MSTAVQNANAARTNNFNAIFFQDESGIDWNYPVNVIPDEKKNPDAAQNKLWVVTAFRLDKGKRTLIAKGTHEYCKRMKQNLERVHAYDRDGQPKLLVVIGALLLAAESAVTRLREKGSSLLWKEQSLLVGAVYQNTAKALKLTEHYTSDSALTVEVTRIGAKARDIRKTANFSIFGFLVWNIQILVDEVLVSQIADLSSKNLVVRPFVSTSKNNRVPKFVTHQLVANDSGKVLVRGSKEGCEAFLANCYYHFTEVREEQARKEAQQRFEQEKEAARIEIRETLGLLATRLGGGEVYGDANDEGSVAYDLEGCIATSNQYGINITAAARGILNIALGIR